MSTQKQTKTISTKAIHSIIGVAIMLLFPLLPISLPQVTPIGMQIIGIFMGTLYLWTTVDPVWSSMISIFMVGVSSFAPMPQVLQMAFGNPVVVQMFFIMVVMNALVYNKLTVYIGRFFLTLKINNGRPWVFSTMLMIGAMLMAAFVGPFAPIFLFWPVLYDIFQEIGFKKGDRYPSIMIILVAIGTLIGFPVPPYSSNGLALLSNYTTITENMGNKVVINNAAYLTLAIVWGLVSIVVIVLFCKFVLRPDVSKLKNLDVEMLKRNPLPPLNSNQKFLAISFVTYIAIMLLPSVFPKVSFMQFLNQNTYGIAMGYAALLAAVNFNKDSDEPVMPFGKTMNLFAWGTYFLCTAAILLGSVLTTESTGISAFLNVILGPIFTNMSLTVFCITLLVITLVLTNLCNSLVIGMLMQPVIASFCLSAGINSAPIVALIIIFVLASAAVTPSASPFAAMIHGNKEWLKSGEIYKYTLAFVAIELILAIVIGLPLANLLIK